MSALTSFTVNDRETTPVAHTYEPQGNRDGIGRFAANAAVPIGDQSLTISIRHTAGRYRVKLVMADPVLVTETINGVDRYKVERTAYCNCEFSFAENSTLQERKNLVGKFAGALGADVSVLNDTITGLEDLW